MYKKISFLFLFLLCVGCSVTPLYDCCKSSELQNIEVDVIANREGQKLRGFILGLLRDLPISKKKYRLSVNLTYSEKLFAFSNDGNAKRVRQSYTADVVLKNENREVIFKRDVSIHSSSNIASAHGEVMLSLYGRNSNTLMKELSHRIVESIKVFLIDES
jgi:hypothetical protein